MKKIIFLMMVLIAVPAFAWERDPWTMQDTILQGVFLSLLYIDYKQTLEIRKNELYYDSNNMPHNHKESNPILGPNPTKKNVLIYMSSCAIIHTGVSYMIPSKPFRIFWQSIGIMFEVQATIHNYQCNIRLKF